MAVFNHLMSSIRPFALLEESFHTPVLVFFCFIDLEWKVIYVGSAESAAYDQVLDTVLVGPVPAGRHMFVFQVCKLYKILSEILCLIKL